MLSTYKFQVNAHTCALREPKTCHASKQGKRLQSEIVAHNDRNCCTVLMSRKVARNIEPGKYSGIDVENRFDAFLARTKSGSTDFSKAAMMASLVYRERVATHDGYQTWPKRLK